MCDVPSIAVFCSESIECFPGTVSKFFFKLLVTIPVAPIITGTIVYFRFHIRFISIHKILYFNFSSTSFCTTFHSECIATYMLQLLLVQSYISGSTFAVSLYINSCFFKLLLLLYDMDVCCNRHFLTGNSLEPAVIPTAQASSFTLRYFPYYV